jgi:hypothetical protein
MASPLVEADHPVTVLAAIATAPIFVWELSLGLWLVVKGFKPSPRHHGHGRRHRLTGPAGLGPPSGPALHHGKVRIGARRHHRKPGKDRS